MNKANGLVGRIKMALGIALLAILSGCVGDVGDDGDNDEYDERSTYGGPICIFRRRLLSGPRHASVWPSRS